MSSLLYLVLFCVTFNFGSVVSQAQNTGDTQCDRTDSCQGNIVEIFALLNKNGAVNVTATRIYLKYLYNNGVRAVLFGSPSSDVMGVTALDMSSRLQTAAAIMKEARRVGITCFIYRVPAQPLPDLINEIRKALILNLTTLEIGLGPNINSPIQGVNLVEYILNTLQNVLNGNLISLYIDLPPIELNVNLIELLTDLLSIRNVVGIKGPITICANLLSVIKLGNCQRCFARGSVTDTLPYISGNNGTSSLIANIVPGLINNLLGAVDNNLTFGVVNDLRNLLSSVLAQVLNLLNLDQSEDNPESLLYILSLVRSILSRLLKIDAISPLESLLGSVYSPTTEVVQQALNIITGVVGKIL